METGLRDRHQRCGCAGEAATDDAIAARCAALPATSLGRAFDQESIGWHGTIAAAHVRRLEGCEPLRSFSLGADDPVLGRAELGEPCRVFADTWGAPDDCAYGARCLDRGGALLCVVIARDGEPCSSDAICEPGLECISGICACAGPTCPDGLACPPAIVSE